MGLDARTLLVARQAMRWLRIRSSYFDKGKREKEEERKIANLENRRMDFPPFSFFSWMGSLLGRIRGKKDRAVNNAVYFLL